MNNFPSAVFLSPKHLNFQYFRISSPDTPLKRKKKKKKEGTLFFYSSILHFIHPPPFCWLSVLFTLSLALCLCSSGSPTPIPVYLIFTFPFLHLRHCQPPPSLSARTIHLLQLRLELAEAPWRLPIRSPDRNSSMSLSDGFFSSPGSRASGSLEWTQGQTHLIFWRYDLFQALIDCPCWASWLVPPCCRSAESNCVA